MNKIILGATLLFATSLGAQTFFQDAFNFAGQFSSHWTIHDEDGDGYNWSNVLIQSYGNVAQSASYVDNIGPVTPDNWMVSEAIDLSSATGSVFLSWEAKAQSQFSPNENYAVYVSTSNNVPTMKAAGSVFQEVIGQTNFEFVSRLVDVSSFIGQTIYIAFRHYDVTNESQLNIDNVLVLGVPYQNDLELTNIDANDYIMGDKTFSIDVTNVGGNAITGFDLDWSFDGGATTTEHVTGINLTYTQKYTLTIPINGVTIGSKIFSAEITTSDEDNGNNSKSQTFNFVVPVTQFIATDSDGNPFNLYDHLQSGQAIIFDFMASWCAPCQTSTPALSQFIENHGSGNGNVQALAITIAQADNASVLNGLNWNGGYYEYPKFPYSGAGHGQYYHYSTNHRFSDGVIPFFVMICPNLADPKMSTIIEHTVGYDSGMLNYYQTSLDQCPTATLNLITLPSESINFTLYPNPTTDVINIDFELQNENNVTVSILNTIGQTVASKNIEGLTGAQNIQFTTSSIEAGMYFVKVKTKTGEQTKRISVVK